jgi:hypothetical protein
MRPRTTSLRAKAGNDAAATDRRLDKTFVISPRAAPAVRIHADATLQLSR